MHCLVCISNASSMIRVPPLLALLMGHVPIPGSSSCELCPTFGARRLARDPGFFSLMSEEIAKGRKLSTVAAVVPTLRLWPGVDYSNGVLWFLCCNWRASVKVWLIRRWGKRMRPRTFNVSMDVFKEGFEIGLPISRNSVLCSGWEWHHEWPDTKIIRDSSIISALVPHVLTAEVYIQWKRGTK